MPSFPSLRRLLLPVALLGWVTTVAAQDLDSLKQQLANTDLNRLKQHVTLQDLEKARHHLDGMDLNSLKQQLNSQDLKTLQQRLGTTDLNSLKQRIDGADLVSLKQQIDGTDLNSLKQHLSDKELGGLAALGGGSTRHLLNRLSSPESRGNAAGLLGYCLKNNYLGADSGASGLKDKLLGALGGQHADQDNGYQQGLQGILQGGQGQSVDLGKVSGAWKQKLTDKVCQMVLKKGGSLL